MFTVTRSETSLPTPLDSSAAAYEALTVKAPPFPSFCHCSAEPDLCAVIFCCRREAMTLLSHPPRPYHLLTAYYPITVDNS
jgi:hypothetical protein